MRIFQLQAVSVIRHRLAALLPLVYRLSHGASVDGLYVYIQAMSSIYMYMTTWGHPCFTYIYLFKV